MESDRKGLRLGFVSLLCVILLTGTALATAEFNKATRLGMLGDYDGALKEYESFLGEHPDDELAPVAALAAGNLYLDVREDYDAAMEKYDQVVKEYPSSPAAPEAARRKGEAAQALEEWTAAGEAFDLALDLAVGHGSQPAGWIGDVIARAGDCFYRAGDNERVIQTYHKVLDRDPAAGVAASALIRMGETYETMDQPEKAAESYVRMLEEYPGVPAQTRRQAMGKRDLIDQHVEFDWKPYELNEEATDLIRQRNFAGARAKCDEVEACCRNPRLLEYVEYRRIALDATLTADYETARRNMGQYLQKYPRAQLLERIEENLETWTRIIDGEAERDANPEDPARMTALGSMYLRAGAFHAAIETVERARDLDPERSDTYQLLGYAYNAAGRTDDATGAFEKYLEGNPEDTNALNMVGYACMGTEQYDKAIRYFRQYAELAPDEANAHDSLGEGLFRAGRLEEAAAEYEKAVEIDPGFSNSYFFLGQIYEQLDKKDRAIEAYERLIGLSPSGSQAEQAGAALAELRGQGGSQR
ncbi:MAG: tetratricopeptide repeat protein [Candidatus Eisenbacteria sp.]|nr:tetratricopeptide repeat protein [Candidatus Eisenbacteria bacterium]